MRTNLICAALLLAACADNPNPLGADMSGAVDLTGAPPGADLTGFNPAPVDLAPAPLAALTITGVTSANLVAGGAPVQSPAVASTVGGDALTITGTGFDTRTSFYFGANIGLITSYTATTATVQAPSLPGGWRNPVVITARRATDSALATNSNAAGSKTAFKYYAAQIAFTERALYNPINGSYPLYPFVGDFNNDGYVDFIESYIASTTLVTMLNEKNGNFQYNPNFVVAPTPANVLMVWHGTVADFDKDNNLDIAYVNGTNNSSTAVQYNLGNGTGAITSRGNDVYGGCSTGTSVESGDYTGDGYPDLVVACYGNAYVALMPNQYPVNGNSAGNVFSNGLQFTLPNAGNPRHATLVDLNKDGKLDLVSVNYNAGGATAVYWWINTGASPFFNTGTPTNGVGTNNANNPEWIACRDLNNDGYPDCVTSESNASGNATQGGNLNLTPTSLGSTVRVFMNDGTGNLKAPLTTAGSTITVGYDSRQVFLDDVNGDGLVDILVANRQSNDIDVIPGHGDGTFGTLLSADNRILMSRQTFTLPCLYPWSVQTADVDNDGVKEIITNCQAGFAMNSSTGGVLIYTNTSQ